MLGIDYVSSDEEDAAPVTTQPEVSSVDRREKGAIATNIELPKSSLPVAAPVPKPDPKPIEETIASEALPVGPQQGPSATPLPEEDDLIDEAPPGSPYTSNRLMVQNLTLPTVPNLDIPPSPPGSPPQRSTKKFAQFLELKKKGQHFNQRLETSSVLRDPNHSRKLMEFAGITGANQYASTLREGLGVPVVWPDWAYSDALNASQKKISKAKESERSKGPRGSVEFVPAKSGSSSGTGTPASKGSRQSATERVMAGLEQRPKDRR